MNLHDLCSASFSASESAPQYKKQMFCDHRTFEDWFPSYGLPNFKESAQNSILYFNTALCTSEN
jgi:hypothetical protein